jgi:hypothetical protein
MKEVILYGKKIVFLPSTGSDLDVGQPMKHYWVRIHGLPRKLWDESHIQKMIQEV